MKKILVLLLFCLTSTLSAAAQQNPVSAVGEIVAAERKFAAAAAESGMKTAFLRYADDDGILFGAQPANAKKIWTRQPESDALLEWKPFWADASSDGKLGFTAGPFAFSPSRKSAPVRFGEYVTIWKKQPDGVWKFVLDIGIHNRSRNFEKSTPLSVAEQTANADTKVFAWSEIENEAVKFLQNHDATEIFGKFASADIRFLREGSEPLSGKNAAIDFLRRQNARLTLAPAGGAAATNLAYAYGEYRLTFSDDKIEKGFYLHIWKREAEGWRVVLDIQQPLPEMPKPNAEKSDPKQ